MNELNPIDGQLLAALKQDDTPSQADRERIRGRLWAELGLGAAVAGTTTAAVYTATQGATTQAALSQTATYQTAMMNQALAAVLPKSGLVLSGVVKVGLGLALGLISTGAIYTSLHGGFGQQGEARTAPALSPATDSDRALALASATPPQQLTQPAPREPAAALVPGPANVDSPRVKVGAATAALDAEVRLLRAAQQALQAGKYSSALAYLSEHAARFPHGLLKSEREASRAIALCQSGQSKAGQQRASRYLRSNADSPLAARVRAACKLD